MFIATPFRGAFIFKFGVFYIYINGSTRRVTKGDGCLTINEPLRPVVFAIIRTHAIPATFRAEQHAHSHTYKYSIETPMRV